MNYNTLVHCLARIIYNTLAECRVMLCKLLIIKDKLRITLEWIHSRAAASERIQTREPVGYNAGQEVAGVAVQQVQQQQQQYSRKA